MIINLEKRFSFYFIFYVTFRKEKVDSLKKCIANVKRCVSGDLALKVLDSYDEVLVIIPEKDEKKGTSLTLTLALITRLFLTSI